ncbi:hypothetical protein OQJ18_04465 [Fluoribacter dumoffii]|uniref:Uncharacterized protein n=1 Tax=Fluoribacter dumoffii TaxID=463 RepID=A0A377G9P1_9GAMM|nr:hypothetical protein [Fluoribacter dumoffii]KTC90314.1 hypothetical protein Ldum_1382 [Fluoribacter dumoffii NY 23]MCW8385632.1 hypothetical protein [Fluoribacter dumoffii]MCW8418661.1 hypothetical protein [Fluoribacter dumoffii]MCW8453496.1 hypothetical protein [Fluoribacter dumoffii]MCW8459285.1 hypothetical protein [Fluoribacter dumoffii]
MFSFLEFKKNTRSDTSSSNSDVKKTSEINPDEQKTNEPSNDTWVFVWNMTANKVGHAAIQVGGSQPKVNADDPGTYTSIHPASIPSAGITSVLPLQAHLASSLSEDMETMGASEGSSFGDMDSPPRISVKESTQPLPPDQIYHFKDLDTSAMNKHIEETQEKVKTGEVGYQLFPNVNVAGFFRDSSAFVAHDPIDVEMYRRSSGKNRNTNPVYNCTTLVSDVLKEGGVNIKPSRYKPWGITPNGLAAEVSESERTHKGPQV